MKKQIKLLGVLAVALTLGLSACNGGGGDDKSQSGGGKDSTSKHVHEAAADAPWQSDDSKHWKDCSANDGGKVDNKSHTFGDPYDIVPATCEAAGSQKVKCSVCQKEVTQAINALGHDWVDDETGGTPATCTTDGSKNQTCSRCDATQAGVVIPALGHDWSAWADVEGKAPTCTAKGEQKRTCSRCNEVETQEVSALGHNMQLIGEDTEPATGKAKVRVYTCANGCGQTYLGFKASEASEEAQKHLSFTQPNAQGEVGASFWGRPIGNALALKADGSSQNEQVDEVVYCSTETGDFFEYIFDLTQDQIDESGLDNCRLYLDAKPADYMNGGDFFAYGGGNTDDWTPGFYIDGAADHIEKDGEGNPVMVKDHAKSVRDPETGAEAAGVELETEVPMGKRITDYRYILYVDDQVKAFEPNVSNPTHGNNTNMTREEFVLPFVFNLHAGENKIRLGMAGGYRSTFYNFTFRPVEEDSGEPEHTHAWTAGEKAADSALRALTCTCDGIGYELQAADLTEGQKAPVSSDKNTRLGKNSLFDDVWNITGIAAGTYDLYLNAQNSSGNDNAYWNAGTAQANGDSASNNGNSTDFRYKVKVDSGEFVNIGSADDANLDQFSDFGLSNAGGAVWTNKPVAQLTIAAGAASLTIHNMDNGYSIWIYGARLIRA